MLAVRTNERDSGRAQDVCISIRTVNYVHITRMNERVLGRASGPGKSDGGEVAENVQVSEARPRSRERRFNSRRPIREQRDMSQFHLISELSTLREKKVLTSVRQSRNVLKCWDYTMGVVPLSLRFVR